MSFWRSLKQRVGFTRAPLDRLNDDYSMFHSMTIRCFHVLHYRVLRNIRTTTHWLYRRRR